MRHSIVLISVLVLGLMTCCCSTAVKNRAVKSSADELIDRIVPQYSNWFQTEIVASDSTDFFEIESMGHKILLRGNNGVSIASALYYYLKEYCHCQITWNGNNLRLPDAPFPFKFIILYFFFYS